jgi:hypothetical protein
MNINYANIVRMTATNCCVCRKSLTDAESVQQGLGPICSGKYYSPTFLPSDEQVKNALGLLAIANLPDEVTDGFVKVVNNDKVNARQGCNLLIYYCSCHYENREEVFKCTSIIRALGYTDLADKLEIDRTVAHIKDKGDHFEVYALNKSSFERDAKHIPNVQMLNLKNGKKEGWFVPKASEAYFFTVLGFYYGGQMACGDKGIFNIPRKSYGDLMAFRRPPRPVQQTLTPNPTSPSVTGKVSIVVGTDATEIYAPYNETFKNELKNQVPYVDRAWTGTCWKVRNSYLATVKNLIQTHFNVMV